MIRIHWSYLKIGRGAQTPIDTEKISFPAYTFVYDRLYIGTCSQDSQMPRNASLSSLVFDFCAPLDRCASLRNLLT